MPSDGRPVRLSVGEALLTARFTHYATPKESARAYLRATMLNAADQPLLPTRKVRVYHDGYPNPNPNPDPNPNPNPNPKPKPKPKPNPNPNPSPNPKPNQECSARLAAVHQRQVGARPPAGLC